MAPRVPKRQNTTRTEEVGEPERSPARPEMPDRGKAGGVEESPADEALPPPEPATVATADDMIDDAAAAAPIDEPETEHKETEILFAVIHAETETTAEGDLVAAGVGLDFGMRIDATIEDADDGAVVGVEAGTPAIETDGQAHVHEDGVDLTATMEDIHGTSARGDATITTESAEGAGSVHREGKVSVGKVEVGSTSDLRTDGEVSVSKDHVEGSGQADADVEIDLGLVSVTVSGDGGFDGRLDGTGFDGRIDTNAGIAVDDRTDEFADDVNDAVDAGAEWADDQARILDEKTAPTREAIEETADEVLSTEAALAGDAAAHADAGVSAGDVADASLNVDVRGGADASVSMDAVDARAGSSTGATTDGRIGQVGTESSVDVGASGAGSIDPTGAEADVDAGFDAETKLGSGGNELSGRIGGGAEGGAAVDSSGAEADADFDAEGGLDLGLVSVDLDIGLGADGRLSGDGVGAGLGVSASADIDASGFGEAIDQTQETVGEHLDDAERFGEGFAEDTADAVADAVDGGEKALDDGGDWVGGALDDATEVALQGSQFMADFGKLQHDTSMDVIENMAGDDDPQSDSSGSTSEPESDPLGDLADDFGDAADDAWEAGEDAVDAGGDMADDAEDVFENVTGIDLDGEDDSDDDDDDDNFIDTITDLFS